MSKIVLFCYAATVGAVTAACANQTAPPVAPVIPQSPARSVPRSQGTLYVAGIYTSSGVLYGYSLPYLRMTYSTSSNLNEPEGITTDSSGAVYVANTYGYNILKFAPPATDPVLRIDDRGYRPTDVAIDSKGNIWVANWCTRKGTCGPGNVREYSDAGKLLHTITCPNLTWYAFLAIDKSDNVIVDGDPPYGVYSSAGEIAAGTSKCTTLSSIHTGAPGGVQFTSKGDVAVIDTVDLVMRTYAKPRFMNMIVATPFHGVPTPVEDAFAKGDTSVWVSVQGYNGVFEFAYPTGGNPINSLQGIYFPTGVAITASK
ncbi:MAG: hypothetical protein JO146_08680 [Candidatus Eremiobacteraeota bacterium]|nr:hypothetical protein [Candidatus Eremiobacteraeota bacterium]